MLDLPRIDLNMLICRNSETRVQKSTIATIAARLSSQQVYDGDKTSADETTKASTDRPVNDASTTN